MGISFKMSKTAMAGMFFGLGSFWAYIIAMLILQFFCGVFSIIFGIIAIVIAVKVWSTEKNRAKAMLAFGLIGLICTVVTMVAWTVLLGSPI
jgi:uncharacterized membrane protein HdeD (DUF308 family)